MNGHPLSVYILPEKFLVFPHLGLESYFQYQLATRKLGTNFDIKVIEFLERFNCEGKSPLQCESS